MKQIQPPKDFAKHRKRPWIGMEIALMASVKTSDHQPVEVNLYALDRTRSSWKLETDIADARGRLSTAREAVEKAEQEIADHTKTRRDQARDDDRRAMLVGRVLLRRAVDKPETWTGIWPWIEKYLQSESDANRALFGLPPVLRVDVAEAAVAADSSGKADAADKQQARSESHVA